MIVTCQECSTSFQLDDARIPASGARVRCSRCKHAFFLPSPSASPSAAVQAVVEQVVEGELGRTPEPTRDLAADARAERAGSALRGEPDEEDWQFSQEIRVAGDDDREEVAAGRGTPPRPDSFDLTGDFGRGFDPETLVPDAPPGPGSAGKASRDEPVRDASGFGSIDDFSSSIEDEDLSIDLATEPPPPRAAVRPAARPVARPSARRAEAVGSAGEDLGDPESWDIVGGEDARRATSRVAALIRPAASKAAPAPRSKGLELFAEAELPPVREELEETPGQGGKHWAVLGRIVGFGITLASVAAVFGLLIQPEWSRGDTGPQRLAIGPLVAETDRAAWLESSRAGLLLVFEGELRNTGTTPLRPIPLQLSLLDRAGARLAGPPLAVGAPLDELTLREGSPRTLSARRNEAISTWLATPLAPGEVRRFVAVATADELPAAARRVALEAGRADGR